MAFNEMNWKEDIREILAGMQAVTQTTAILKIKLLPEIASRSSLRLVLAGEP